MLRFLGAWLLAQAALFADAHVFVLHRFDDAKHASTSISASQLERHFTYLKTHGYKAVSLETLTKKIASKEPVPDTWVHFSIDDSYRSFYTHGLPLFKKHDIPFSLYVYIEAVERGYRDYMHWDEIREASRYGAIGLHSYGHDHLTHLTDAKLHADTQKGVEVFTRELGFRPQSYAYPYGEYDARVKKIVSAFGFESIMNQNAGAVSHATPLDDIDRIALMQDTELKSKLGIKHLSALWKRVTVDRSAKKIGRVEIILDPSIKAVELYVTGNVWQKIKTKEGKITQNLDIPLKNSRSRIIIKTAENAWSSYIIVL